MKEIELNYKNQSLVINILGGGIKEYYLVKNGQKENIIYGYSKDEEKSGSMGDILFPFPGRIENSEYTFEGKKYKLSGLKIKDGHAIHGFAKLAIWKLINKTENSATLSFSMTKKEYEAKGFPFGLTINVTYSLSGKGLMCSAEILNMGDEAAPFGLGFHPYFSINGAKVDEMFLQIPANKMVEFAPNLKPTGQFLEIDGDLDFGTQKKIGDLVIDNCFTDLNYENDEAKTTLSVGDVKITIWQDQNLPYLQLYSADTIGEDHLRKGLAIEAQTCTGFVLNMPEMGLKVLQPGEKFTASWGIMINNNQF